MGINRKVQLLSKEARLTIGSDREKIAPWGLLGGKSGSPFSIKVREKNNSTRSLNSKTTTDIKEGDIIEILTPGGGGWGNPFERDIGKVDSDIHEGFISTESAAEDYGVVFKKDEKMIDVEQTKKLRQGITKG